MVIRTCTFCFNSSFSTRLERIVLVTTYSLFLLLYVYAKIACHFEYSIVLASCQCFVRHDPKSLSKLLLSEVVLDSVSFAGVLCSHQRIAGLQLY